MTARDPVPGDFEAKPIGWRFKYKESDDWNYTENAKAAKRYRDSEYFVQPVYEAGAVAHRSDNWCGITAHLRLSQEVARLAAENARMREALVEIARLPGRFYNSVEIASAALEPPR